MKDIIFIHIPKTGGTTLNAAMNNTMWQTEPDFNYRHILPKTMVSNSGDIFDPRNFEKFKAYKIFMMLRHPVDRVISEFHFIRDRKGFIDLLKRKPKNLEEYIKLPQTQNGVVNFLKGRRMYSEINSSQSDLDDILDAIDEIPIHIGIFEQYAKSVDYLKDALNLPVKNQIEVKRITFKRPSLEEVDENIKNLILENNTLDLALYDYGLQFFNKVAEKYTGQNLKFIADKYNHVIPYCYNWCFFEYCLENKKYINQNLDYFKQLTFYLINELKITNGKTFTKVWLQSYLNKVKSHFTDASFYQKLKTAYENQSDPLMALENVAEAIEQFLNSNPNQSWYNPMTFNKDEVAIPESGIIKLIKKLF